MYNHAPDDYRCPFCALQEGPGSDGWQRNRKGWVFEEGAVFCMVPTHYWGKTKGNCLIIPKPHFENIYELDESIGVDIIRATKRVSLAMKTALGCEGVSTRQHNEPAGNQDVWHYHLHVFPRYAGDNLYESRKMRYTDEERAEYASRLRNANDRARGAFECDSPTPC